MPTMTNEMNRLREQITHLQGQLRAIHEGLDRIRNDKPRRKMICRVLARELWNWVLKFETLASGKDKELMRKRIFSTIIMRELTKIDAAYQKELPRDPSLPEL